MPLLISNSETVKYLQVKILGKNFICLFSPIYFVVGFGYSFLLRPIKFIVLLSGNGMDFEDVI